MRAGLDAFRFLILITLMVIVLVILPAMRSAENYNNVSLEVASEATRQFVDLVRSKGYMDSNDYLNYQDQLNAAGKVYSVTLEYQKKKYQPLYTDPNDYATFTDNYETLYEGYYTLDILNRIFPKSGGIPEGSPERRYNMYVGDFFTVNIESEGTDTAALIRSLVSPSSQLPITFRYGGMIRSEAP